jgi:hypothetical protein
MAEEYGFYLPESIKHLYAHDAPAICEEWLPGPGDVCLDAGFGPGTWTLAALSRGAEVHELLERALAANGGFSRRCRRYRCGLSDSCGLSDFVDGIGTFAPSDEKAVILTVDSLRLGRLDYVNMDVEGSEYRVLVGAKETLKKFGPKLIIEVHSNVGVSPDEMKRLLGECGYSSFREAHGFLVADRRE